MFEVKLLVEDNKLSKLLWALDGLVLGNPEATPLKTNTAIHDGKPQGVANPTARPKRAVGENSSYMRILRSMLETHPNGFTFQDINNAGIAMGYSKNIGGTTSGVLMERGFIKRVGVGQYVFTSKGLASKEQMQHA